MRPRLSTGSSTSEMSCDQLQRIVEKVGNSAASMRKELKRVASQRSRRLGCAAQPKPGRISQGTLVKEPWSLGWRCTTAILALGIGWLLGRVRKPF
jgi:hypothetical protein